MRALLFVAALAGTAGAEVRLASWDGTARSPAMEVGPTRIFVMSDRPIVNAGDVRMQFGDDLRPLPAARLIPWSEIDAELRLTVVVDGGVLAAAAERVEHAVDVLGQISGGRGARRLSVCSGDKVQRLTIEPGVLSGAALAAVTERQPCQLPAAIPRIWMELPGGSGRRVIVLIGIDLDRARLVEEDEDEIELHRLDVTGDGAELVPAARRLVRLVNSAVLAEFAFQSLGPRRLEVVVRVGDEASPTFNARVQLITGRDPPERPSGWYRLVLPGGVGLLVVVLALIVMRRRRA